MNERWGLIVAAVAFTGLGLLAGFQAGRGSAPGVAGSEDDAADEEGTADEHATEIEFSPQALQNLGVTTAPLQLTSWTRTERVAAVIEEAPLARRPVHAPIAGRVAELLVTPPQLVDGGAPLLDLYRDPIPLPPIELTADALHPAHEEIHRALRNLRQARGEIAILDAEIARVEGVSDEEDLPLIPYQRRIELEYDLERARILADQSAHELEKHGFSAAQVEALARGDHLPFYGAANVRRTLDHNGLWRDDAVALESSLPQSLRELPLVIATVGELAAHGLASAQLSDWLAEDPEAAEDFLPIASLLLTGSSLTSVQDLHRRGALDARVVIRAPDDRPDWDLLDVRIREGAHVEAGMQLLTLRDGRDLRLRATPVGSEVEALLAALRSGRPCRATPLLTGTGPELDGLRILQVAERDDRTVAFLSLDNRALETDPSESGRAPARSWELRPGVRYELRVPVERLDNVFVLPVTALTEDGPDRVVLVPDAHGDVFAEVPVVVHAENDEVVVLRAEAQDPRLEPGVPVVRTGAFEIGLALHAGDHDVGHSHGH